MFTFLFSFPFTSGFGSSYFVTSLSVIRIGGYDQANIFTTITTFYLSSLRIAIAKLTYC